MECIHAQQQWRAFPFYSAIYRTRHSSFDNMFAAVLLFLLLLHCNERVLLCIHFGPLSLSMILYVPSVSESVCVFFSIRYLRGWLRMLYLDAVVKT